MSIETLKERGDALENQFFKEENEKVLETLRAQIAKTEQREVLSAASGVDDPAVLDALASAGISGETLTALALVPLVVVAWADGNVDDLERSAILKAFGQANSSQANNDLLDGWLNQKPDSTLFETWRLYIHAILEELDSKSKDALQSQLVDGAREVAEAAGGFLGLGNKISAKEASVLDELEACFQK